MTIKSPDPLQPGQRQVQVRTAASDKRKALQHYQDLRRSGKVERALIIAELVDGSVQILGQMLTPAEIAQLLGWAIESMRTLDDERRKHRLEPHRQPTDGGVHNGGIPRRSEVRIGKDGCLMPPAGESMIACGECHHPRWYISHDTDRGTIARYVCAHCGNEIKLIPVMHEAGHA